MSHSLHKNKKQKGKNTQIKPPSFPEAVNYDYHAITYFKQVPGPWLRLVGRPAMQTAAWTSSKGVGCGKGSAGLRVQASSFLFDCELQDWGISTGNGKLESCKCGALWKPLCWEKRELGDYRSVSMYRARLQPRKECASQGARVFVSTTERGTSSSADMTGTWLTEGVLLPLSLPSPAPWGAAAVSRGRQRTSQSAALPRGGAGRWLRTRGGEAGSESAARAELRCGSTRGLFGLKASLGFVSCAHSLITGGEEKKTKPAAAFT